MILKLKYFIESMRLRTLPLAISGVIVGGALAAYYAEVDAVIIIFSLVTAILLQVVSNVANELGDLQKGTDNIHRQGPIRSVQKGNLSYIELFVFMWILILMSAFSGSLLVYYSFATLFGSTQSVLMLALGALAIWASVKYTFGGKSYGYIGLGDFFVFLFFGLVAVMGVYYLIAKSLDISLLLPASAIGFLSTAMLNQNNMRDMDNDKNFSKKTMVVRMGLKRARIYHLAIISLAFLLMTIFVALFTDGIKTYLFWLSAPVFIYHLFYVFKNSGKELDKHMKLISLGTLLFALLVCLGFVF